MGRGVRSLRGEPEGFSQSRLFIREPGWTARIKQGSEREFCFVTAPGEAHYHRLADGELHLQRGDERICLPCAGRQGLLGCEPRGLGESRVSLDLQGQATDEAYDLTPSD